MLDVIVPGTIEQASEPAPAQFEAVDDEMTRPDDFRQPCLSAFKAFSARSSAPMK